MATTPHLVAEKPLLERTGSAPMLRHFQNRPPHQQGIAWRRPEENHTKTVDRGKTTGKPWENHKTIAKPWENDDSTKKENEDFCMDLKLIYDSYTML